MLIKTIHPRLISGVDNKLYEFKHVETAGKFSFYEGEVPDEVGKHLLAIKRTPFEYNDVTAKEPEAPTPEPVKEPVVVDSAKMAAKAKGKK